MSFFDRFAELEAIEVHWGGDQRKQTPTKSENRGTTVLGSNTPGKRLFPRPLDRWSWRSTLWRTKAAAGPPPSVPFTFSLELGHVARVVGWW